MGTLQNPSTTSSPDSNQGELNALTQSQKEYKIQRYPLELGNQNDILHYVVFYINLPESSKYLKSNAGNIVNEKSAAAQNFDYLSSKGLRSTSLTTGQQAATATGGAAVGGAASEAYQAAVSSEEANYTGAASGAAGTAIAGAAGTQIDLQPRLKRISTAIAIYMPDTIYWNYQHNWSAVSATEAAGKVGNIAALTAGALQIGKGLVQGTAEYASGEDADYTGKFRQSPTAMEAIGKGGEAAGLGKGATELALRSAGMAVNPQVEMIFSGTGNRQFVFEFMFQARSQAEAQSIRDIILSFRRYAAPELVEDTQNGRYFIPPAQFDIKFFFQNAENINMAKISTCVLTDVYVDDGNGFFSTFNDGMPVQVGLKLQFTEIDIIYRELIERFGY